MKNIKMIKTGVITVVLCLALTGLSEGNNRYRYSGNNNIGETYRGSLRSPSIKTDTENMTMSEMIDYTAERVEEGDISASNLQGVINLQLQLSDYHGEDHKISRQAAEVRDKIQGLILGDIDEEEALDSVNRLSDLADNYNNDTEPDAETVNPEEGISEEPSTDVRINIGVLDDIAKQIRESNVNEETLQYATEFADQLISYHEGKPEMNELDERIVELAEETVEALEGVIRGSFEESEASKMVWRLRNFVNLYKDSIDTDDVSETPEEGSYEVVNNYRNLSGIMGRISKAIRNFLPSVIQPLFMRSGIYELFQNYPEGSSISLTAEEREDYKNTLNDLENPEDVEGFFRGEYDNTSYVNYNNTLMNMVFGDPAGLFLNREGNCHSFARFAQEALENMPEGVEPYETRLIHNTYDEHSDSHVMLAYRDPETGTWGFMDPYINYSPEMIEEAGINPVNPEAIVEFIGIMYEPGSDYSGIPGSGSPKRITLLDNSDSYVFDKAYIINGDGTYERETLFQRVMSYLFS